MSDERIERLRQQLMKAEWPHGGHGTLDSTLAALDSLQKELERLQDALRLLRSARDELTQAVRDGVDVGTYQDYYDDRETAIDEAIVSLTPHSTKGPEE